LVGAGGIVTVSPKYLGYHGKKWRHDAGDSVGRMAIERVKDESWPYFGVSSFKVTVNPRPQSEPFSLRLHAPESDEIPATTHV